MAFSAFGAKPAGAGTSLFGQTGAAPATQPQQSLFGTNNASSSAPKPAFGAFGAQTQPAQGSSLFGGQSVQQQQPQQPSLGSSLFSTTAGQQQQTTGSSLFGQTQPAQQTTGTGLFGQSAGAQPQGQQSSLFGNTATQNQPAQSNSLFGTNTTQNQPAQSNSLFGSSSTQPGQGLFSNTLTQPQQQTQSSLFGNAFGASSGIGTSTLGQSTLGGFGTSTAPGLQKQPTSGGFGAGGGANIFGRQTTTQPLGATTMALPFTKATKFNDLPDEIKRLFENIEYVRRHAITSTLEAQHATFIALASRTAAVDAELQKIKALYIQLWRAKTGSMRDPFNDLDRGAGGEFGLESLGGK
ncbi:hypothetical protein EIP86_006429 [Pleurotus ostreatoroseus]|nr:hypothetical protein EIP86_006429 [Pleurotus ostreatoroseus]